MIATVAKVLADKAGISEAKAKEQVDNVLESIKEALVQDNYLRLDDFGALYVKIRAARKGRNPQTGEAIDIPAKNVVKFKPYADLSDRFPLV